MTYPKQLPALDPVRRGFLGIALIVAVVAAASFVVTLLHRPTGSSLTGASDSPTPAASSPRWRLHWSDEFSGPAGSPADPENWTYETGGSGWGNNELQYYTEGAENGSLNGNGEFVITVQKVDPAASTYQCWYGPCQYTSARLITQHKQDFQFGRIEARAMTQEGAGTWPAVWMLGSDIGEVGWPQSGEIDVMEFVGRVPNEVFGTVHGPGYSGGQAWSGVHDFGRSAAGAWHNFAVEWSPGEITWEVDGVIYHRMTPEDLAPNEWVFDDRFFLLMNMAIGGNFGGDVAAEVPFPRSFHIDYVRVYTPN